MSSRKERSKEKKRSKPSLFRDNKKRTRSGSSTASLEQSTQEEEKPPKTKSITTWKSLPRPSKISQAPDNEKIPPPKPVSRRSMSAEGLVINSDSSTMEVKDLTFRVCSDDDSAIDAEIEEPVKSTTTHSHSNSSAPQYCRDFVEIEKIAVTSTGDIFKVQSKKTNDFYAIKRICFPHFDETHESYNQILIQIFTLAQLSHRNIVQYYHSWIEFEGKKNGCIDCSEEETSQSFLLTPQTSVPRPGSIIEDGSLSESIDSSITCITFTEYAVTSDTENFDDDPTDEIENEFGTDSFPFGDDSHKRSFQEHSKVNLYIQMEFSGTTLQDYLNQRSEIDEEKSLLIFKQILDGIKYLHSKNLAHRDLRPCNIFLFQVPNQSVPLVKIGDFSVTTDDVPFFYRNKIGESNDLNGSQGNDGFIGDYAYASPELRRGSNCTQSTDIFSLGVILFELFYNCSPNREKVLRELRRRILPSSMLLTYPTVSSVVLWLMSPEQEERPTAIKVQECALFQKMKQEHVVIPKKELEDLDKKLQNQESTIHEQESIIKQQEKRIQELMKAQSFSNS